ncbi:uncharacterized protein N7500_006628 [Penicillium coprophilum]|uniref:uncharacterized protein n=1 Tax=Penicillium coprophilum TaxID=36646 RepID=UPI00239EF893|nr:uncharacterized protein N7500_006628 [Penicillium coprophilum]KAJ5164798.1 hypothetical protein N7500_006628 [Penicillium coprophilum]
MSGLTNGRFKTSGSSLFRKARMRKSTDGTTVLGFTFSIIQWSQIVNEFIVEASLWPFVV